MVEMVWVKVTFIVSWNNARWCHCWDAGSAQWPGWNLLRSRVEALNTLNLYKTPCARQKPRADTLGPCEARHLSTFHVSPLPCHQQAGTRDRDGRMCPHSSGVTTPGQLLQENRSSNQGSQRFHNLCVGVPILHLLFYLHYLQCLAVQVPS